MKLASEDGKELFVNRSGVRAQVEETACADALGQGKGSESSPEWLS